MCVQVSEAISLTFVTRYLNLDPLLHRHSVRVLKPFLAVLQWYPLSPPPPCWTGRNPDKPVFTAFWIPSWPSEITSWTRPVSPGTWDHRKAVARILRSHGLQPGPRGSHGIHHHEFLQWSGQQCWRTGCCVGLWYIRHRQWDIRSVVRSVWWKIRSPFHREPCRDCLRSWPIYLRCRVDSGSPEPFVWIPLDIRFKDSTNQRLFHTAIIARILLFQTASPEIVAY